MCTPAGIMTLQGISGGLNVMGSIAGGRAQKKLYNSQAAAFETQSELEDISTQRQIAHDTRRAAYESGEISKAGKKVFGAQKAAMAAAGVNMASGSALDLIADSAYSETLDQNMLADNLAETNFEKRLQNKLTNINLRNKASQARIAGRNAATSGYMDAFSEMINTGATVAGSWYKMYGGENKNNQSGQTVENKNTPAKNNYPWAPWLNERSYLK